MREIKFRARIKGGFLHDLWVYSTGFYFDDVNYWVLQPAKDNHAIAFADQAIVDPDTLGQFTGLHDRDGREIYEGDIVTLQSWKPSTMQIRFIEGAFCLADSDGYCVADIHYVQHAGRPIAIIIGNIHDNPELLTIGGKE